MRLYFERLPDGSYDCSCNELVGNTHPVLVSELLQALYNYCRERLEGIAEADIVWTNFYEFASSDKRDSA